MVAVLIEEDLVFKERIIDKDLPEGQIIHDFLLSRAKKLAGKYIDFDKTPVTFVFSEREDPNAFFAPISEFKDRPKLKRRPDEREDSVIYTPNPYETPVICVTKGLIEMVDNLDQLDYILGHELTHLILNGYGTGDNSKGEEEISDLHSIDLVYDAGGDPKQALVIADKIRKYNEAKKEEQSYGRNADQKGINWSEVFSPYLTSVNRRSAIEASLTRLSHLIDDRTPTEIDKSIFVSSYTDPIEALLDQSGYKDKDPVEKLKTLIDMVDILSEDPPSEEETVQKIEDLSWETPEGFITEEQRRILILRERRSDRFDTYYSGKVMQAKYKQKITELAEKIFNEIYQAQAEEFAKAKKEAEEKGEYVESFHPKNTFDPLPALIYLQDKAYAHIAQHGYPEIKDMNYHDASSMLYSYFYTFLIDKTPSEIAFEYETNPPTTQPRIKTDIRSAVERIRNAQDAESFISAYKEINSLYDILSEIRSISFGYRGYGNKMENLSLLEDYRHVQYDSLRDVKVIYSDKDRKPGQIVAWNNLIDIAKTDKESEALVIVALAENSIVDYRITHGLPYVKINNRDCYKIDENGRLSEDKIPKYELDFALNRDDVLAAYDYIRTYFDNENEYIEEICQKALSITEENFKGRELFIRDEDDQSNSREWAYNLISTFNSLPKTEEEKHDHEGKSVLSSISINYRRKNTIPGTDEENKFKLNGSLFEYDNPIFQEQFGADFKELVKAKKQAQQQKLFETTIATLENIADLWLSVSEKQNKIEKEIEALRDSKGKASFTDEEDEKYSKLCQEADKLRMKEDDLSSLIHNITFGIFSRDASDYHIQRLTDEQKIKIAELVVRDDKGIFRRVFKEGRYENFCNYLNILVGQTDQVVSGNYNFTPMMSMVANNLGYEVAIDREEIESFVKNDDRGEYSGDIYTRYLNAFDLARYLSSSSEIDISVLTKSLQRIQRLPSDSYGRNSSTENSLYAAYKKFITNNSFLNSIERVMQNENNFDDFSFDRNIEVIDNIVKFKEQMNNVLELKTEKDPFDIEYENRYRYDYSVSKIRNRIRQAIKSLTDIFQAAAKKLGYLSAQERLEKRNAAFLEIVDERLNNRLRAAEEQILQMDDALEKINKLHWFYNHDDDSYSSDPHRTKSLYSLNKKEGNLEKIAQLAEDESFWPEDPLDHIKAFIIAKETFIDDIGFENDLLNQIFDKVESLPSGKKKNECLYLLLDQKLRASHPETRQRLFDIYTNDIFSKLGYDDGSEKYQNRLAVYIKAIEGGKKEKEYNHSSRKEPKKYDDFITKKMSSADKYILLRQVSDRVISQEKTSEMFKKSCQISLDPQDLQRSYLYGIGLDTLTSDLDRNPETANKFIQFLNSKGEMSDCDAISAHMQKNIRDRERLRDHQNSEFLNNELEKVSPERCKLLYDNFWSAPLEARAVITARILKSAAHSEEIDDQNSWEAVFDVVMKNIIHPDDDSIEAKYAQDIMHSYIKSRSDYERELILSAMMVANRNIGEDAGNVGKALKLFLENMGPAEIKLGQAIASHPSTPESIRRELQDLKNAADIPARWTLYDWIKNENIPEEFWKDQYLGEILGSASYYTTVALGDDEVLRILRPEAREKAKKGFKVIGDTVEDLQEKDEVSDLDYRELTSSVQEMVKQAARMSYIETDHDIGQTQYECAQEIYNGVIIHSGTEAFSLKVMDWNAKGKNWIKLKRAKGYLFNDLPENTAEQIKYKKQFAKGYITFELGNILSGKKFDHDKHGAQLCVDPETNEVGIFDTGAMATTDPSEEEQRLLGNVIYDVIKTSITGEKSFSAFSTAITKKIDELHDKDIDTQYLVEVKKGILALGDFFNVLDENDVKEIMPGMEMLSQLSLPIQQGIYEKMSTAEKAQLQVFSATKIFTGNKSVTIYRNGTPSIVSDVANITAEPDIQDKSTWLSNTFARPDADEDEPPKMPPVRQEFQPRQLVA